MHLKALPLIWNGKALVPVPKFERLAERQFVVGHTYVLEPHEFISHKERSRFMATVGEAHANLSAEALARYPTPSHLRKWALIKAGWRKEHYAAFATHEEASRHAAFLRGLDDMMVVVVSENVVRAYIARTQRVGDPEMGFMTKEEFRQSADDVLAILSGTIGVSQKALEREGRAKAE